MPNHSKQTHKAYPEIVIQKNPTNKKRFDWIVRIYSYQPLGYKWQGKVFDNWPDSVAQPVFPAFPNNGTRSQIDNWRLECHKINISSPEPITMYEEITGYAESEDEAIAYDLAKTSAIDSVDAAMKNYER